MLRSLRRPFSLADTPAINVNGRDALVDPRATFIGRFGDLVALLRSDPGNDAAQDLALTAAGAAIEHGTIRFNAVGSVLAADTHPLSLVTRLLTRGVAAIEVNADADLNDLLRLARALAHDTMPLPASPQITLFAIAEPSGRGGAGPAPSGPGVPIRGLRSHAERRAGRERRRSTQLRSKQPRWLGPERRGSERRIITDRRQSSVNVARAQPASYRYS